MFDFTYQLFQPYFELSKQIEGPLHSQSPLVSYELLTQPQLYSDTFLLPTRGLPPAFRDNLVRQTGKHNFKGFSPLDVLPEHRSDNWKVLCEATENLLKLSPKEKLVTSILLVSLCYYELVSNLLKPHSDITENCDAFEASLAYISSFASYMLYTGDRYSFNFNRVYQLANAAPLGCKAKFSACLLLLVYYSRDNHDLHNIAVWRRETQKAFHSLPVEQETFPYLLLKSRFHRAASFLPFFRNDLVGATEEMNIALDLVRRAKPKSWVEEVVWAGTLEPALQSAAKVALKLGEIDQMLALLKERVSLDPWDALSLIELGDGFLRWGKVAEAASAYRRAALVGPPGTSISWYLAGWCHEQLDELVLASECYIKSLMVDPKGITPLKRLGSIKRTEHTKLFKFIAKERLCSVS